MTSTLTGILIGAALVVVAIVRGSRPYEETFVVPGGPEEWLQKCHDALEGAPHFSDVKVSDDPLQVQARYRQRPGVWGRLTVTMLAEGSASTQITARATVAPTPVTAHKAPRVPNRRTAHSATGPTPTGRTAGTTSEVAEHWISRFAGRDQDITEGVLMRKLLKNRNADDIGEKFQMKVRHQRPSESDSAVTPSSSSP